MRQVPLTYPLPPVQWVRSENGLWYSREWTKEAKEAAQAQHFKYVPENSSK